MSPGQCLEAKGELQEGTAVITRLGSVKRQDSLQAAVQTAWQLIPATCISLHGAPGDGWNIRDLPEASGIRRGLGLNTAF